MTRSSKRRAALERSATSSRVQPVSRPVLNRPAYPTFISSRSTRRTSWTQVDDVTIETTRTAQNGFASRRAEAIVEAEQYQAPKLTRKGTYSSLPPSPTGAIRVDEAGLCDLSEQSPAEFASLTLGIDPDSEDVLALAIQRIAAQRVSITDQESTGSDLRATSLPPDDFFGNRGPTISSLLSLPDLQRSLSRDQEDDVESLGGVDAQLSALRTEHSSDDEDERLEDEIFEDASGFHEGSPPDNTYFPGMDSIPLQYRPEEFGRRLMEKLSWWDVLREAVVEEEEQVLEIQGKWSVYLRSTAIDRSTQSDSMQGSYRQLSHCTSCHREGESMMFSLLNHIF